MPAKVSEKNQPIGRATRSSSAASKILTWLFATLDHPSALLRKQCRQEAPVSKLGIWLAGILASVIAGYAVWYFTQPPATTILEGMAYSANAAVPKAMVSLTLKGNGADSGPFHNVTDENGSYRFDFTGLPSTTSATLSVVASGFHDPSPKSVGSPLGPDTHLDLPLTPLVVPRRPPDEKEHAPLEEHKPNYVRKAAEQATLVRLKP